MSPQALALPARPAMIHFEKLDCWQEATALGVEIYKLSGQGEFGRDF